MSSNSLKNSLAKKLLNAKRRAKNTTVPDIEDCATSLCGTTSDYFSPLQTRHQRKQNLELSKINEEVNATGIRAVPEFDDWLTAINGTYFSPLQTRNQRKMKMTEKVQAQNTSRTVAKVPHVPDTSFAEKPITSHTAPAKQHWQPEHWAQVLENIRKMRAQSSAPVDTMGCHKCADKNADEKTQRFHKLVALMLSSQTKDETTFEAMQRLKSYKRQLTPDSLLLLEQSELEDLLHPVSFYKNKAKYLQKTAHILVDKYDSDIPDNLKELIALPGVGPKMAHICMATAWNVVTGIGVDVHVHRIANRLHWVQRETKEPERTRVALETWLPRELWSEVNYLLVGFGQTICTPLRPHCAACLNNKICPSANTVKPSNVRLEEHNFEISSPIKKLQLPKH